MPKKARKQPEKVKGAIPVTAPVQWLRADYHFHVFHYRMPGTVAIAAVTPFVPSPLTVKLALVASLLQSGDENSAQKLAPYLPQIEVRIIPPSSAFSFKAFLRYRSVPAVESSGGMDESGSYYPSRPHTREYALFSDILTIFLGLPKNIPDVESLNINIVKQALWRIRYLGCKDSLVTCLSVEELSEDDVRRATASAVQPLQENISGAVILSADFEPSASVNLKELIPSGRKEEHYCISLLVLPGSIFTVGRCRVFKRDTQLT